MVFLSIVLLKCCASKCSNFRSVDVHSYLMKCLTLFNSQTCGPKTPLHESGTECNPKRLYTFTLLVAKIYSKVLANRVLEWSINNNILIQEQFDLL